MSQMDSIDIVKHTHINKEDCRKLNLDLEMIEDLVYNLEGTRINDGVFEIGSLVCSPC